MAIGSRTAISRRGSGRQGTDTRTRAHLASAIHRRGMSATLRRKVLDQTSDDRLVRLVDLDVGQGALGRAVLDRPQHALATIAELGVAVVLEQPDAMDQRLGDLLDDLE